MNCRNLPSWISSPRVLASAFALVGSVVLFDGCASKTGCVNCHIGGVMLNSGAPSASPDSALYIQLDGSSKTVSSVEVTLHSEKGKTETHSYSGAVVSGINTTSPTKIPDLELYDVDGAPPTEATAKIIFSDGTALETSLGIEAEGSSGTDPKLSPKDQPTLEPAPTIDPSVEPKLDPAIQPKE